MKDIWILSNFELLSCYKHLCIDFCVNAIFTSMGQMPRRAIARSCGSFMFFFRNLPDISRVSVPFYISVSNALVIHFLHPCQHLVLRLFSDSCIVISHHILMFISQMINNAEYFFICLFASSFLKCVFMSAHVLIGLYFYCWVFSLYILDATYGVCRHFLPVCSSFFHPLNRIFWRAKVFWILMKFNLSLRVAA